MINLSNQSPLLRLPQLRSSSLRFFYHIVEHCYLCFLFDSFNFPFRNKLQRLVYHDNNNAPNVGQGSNLVLDRADRLHSGSPPRLRPCASLLCLSKTNDKKRGVIIFGIGEVETKLTCINKIVFYSVALGARMARAWSGVSWIYAVDETGLDTATAKIKPCAKTLLQRVAHRVPRANLGATVVCADREPSMLRR